MERSYSYSYTCSLGKYYSTGTNGTGNRDGMEQGRDGEGKVDGI